MQRKYPKPRPVAIDFFCGAGGMSLGFEQAGFDIALGVDIDGHHVATHDRNFPCGKSLCASIVNLTGASIRRLIDNDGDIDLVVGGPPCQGFSNMGLRDLRDPRNSLIDHYIRLVLELRPKAFVMENVPGLLAGETRKVLETVIQVAAASGYNITLPVRILDASDFGVPQQRKRLFVLGVRNDIGATIHYPDGLCAGQPKRPNVWQAISDLPNVDKNERLFAENDAPYTTSPESEYAKVMRGIVADPSDLSRPRIWNADICSGCLRTKHAPGSVALYSATPPGETVPGHKLPRLDPKGLCPTLRAGSDSTHGSYTAPRPIHPRYPRCITAREAARLHGFPDWFALYPLKWHAYRQVGNAVCPPVARAIGFAIRGVLGGRNTTVAPSAMPLGETFILPEDRPRALKRIPHIRQYPPVIAYLFDKAFDKRSGRLRNPTFTFADVKAAINATGVNLHWVREDTFVAEFARSRRVTEMLEPALSRGYSILPRADGKVIGEFVPIGTPGTVEDKETIPVRIDELHDAVPLPLSEFDLNGRGRGVVKILSQKQVQERLWAKGTWEVGPVGEIANTENGSTFAITVRKARLKPQNVSVVTCKAAAMPSKPRVARIAKENASERVIVLVAATTKHLVAVQFDHCLSNPRESARVAFELS